MPAGIVNVAPPLGVILKAVLPTLVIYMNRPAVADVGAGAVSVWLAVVWLIVIYV